MTKQEELVVDEETDTFFKRLDGAGITGRNLELFMPLMMLAQFIDKEVFEDIFRIASDMVKEKKATEYTESKDVSLYQFISSKEDLGSNFIAVKDLTRELRTFMGEEDNDDRWLNEKWVGRALKRLNLVIDKRKMKHGAEITLNFEKAKEKLRIFQPQGTL